MKPTHWDVAARTHAGNVRAHNEDSFVADARRGRFAVIDGMGGSAAGIVAADMTRRALVELDLDPADALLEANRAIRSHAEADPRTRGMGCVATVAELHGEMVRLSHVGDTRAYLASAVGTEQLTRDHTAKAADQEAYGLSDAQARTLPDQHAVTNDIGGRPRRDTSWVERLESPFERGDVLVLCSDGLHDVVPNPELFGLLSQARKQGTDASHLADRLLHLALSRGGPDNVTILVVRRRRAADQLVAAIGNVIGGDHR